METVAAGSEPLNRFRDEAKAIREAADLQILDLLCAAASAVTALLAVSSLLRARGSPFLWVMLLGFACFVGLAIWTHRTRRIQTGLAGLAVAMVVGIAIAVLLQRGSHAPATVYGLATIAVIFIAGHTRLGTWLAVGLTTWIALVTWASATGRFSIDIANPLGLDNARLLAFMTATALIGSAAFINQRRHKRLDRLLEQSLNLTETERDDARRLAERRARTVTEIGHEIRTPMTGIVGATQLLSQQPMSPLQRQLLSIQRESAERLLQLVTAVLDEARLESSRAQASHLPYAPRNLCAEVMELFAAQAHRKGIEIIWTADPAVPHLLLGDAMRIRQVLTNLVSNAVKFTDRGVVHLGFGLAAPERLCIKVIDSGRGIPPERLEAIFEHFVSETSGTEHSHSTGLGLPICRELARLMGGDVSAAHVQAGGSRFTLELPCVAAIGSSPEPADIAAAPPGRLWVVGASAALQTQLRFMLEDLGTEACFIDELPDAATWDAGRPMVQAVMLDIWQGHGRRVDLMPAALDAARLQQRRLILVNSVAQDAALGVLDSVWQLFRPPRRASLREALIWAFDSPALHPAGSSGGRSPLRVLLVDDNAVNQIVGRAMLETLGASVVVVDGGEAALVAAALEIFDIVLMDLQMPEMDGFEATRRLRQLELAENRPRRPVLAVTGLTQADIAVLCQEAGIDSMLSKPYTVEQLRTMLAGLTAGALSQTGL